MEGSPPNQTGNEPLIEAPATPHNKPNKPTATKACRSTERARNMSPAPMAWATWTEKPVATAEQVPPKSHVVVDTKPMEAAAPAPKLPTIAASIYCMTMEDNCAMMAGMLNFHVKLNCWPNVMGWPLRISASRSFDFIRCKDTAIQRNCL